MQVGHELDSLTAVIDQLDADAAEESRLNQGMAGVMLGRLQSGRAAAERTLGVLQVRAAAGVAAAWQHSELGTAAGAQLVARAQWGGGRFGLIMCLL